MTPRRRRPEDGFTLVEVLMSVALLTIGVVGIMALQLTLVRSNRLSRENEQAKVYATQIMEVIRSCNVNDLTTCKGLAPVITTITTPDNVTFARGYTVTTVAGSTGLVLVTTTATYFEDGDSANAHTAEMQMVRTLSENL